MSSQWFSVLSEHWNYTQDFEEVNLDSPQYMEKRTKICISNSLKVNVGAATHVECLNEILKMLKVNWDYNVE